MASENFSYHKQKQESWLIDDESKEEGSLGKIRRWSKITRSLGRRSPKVRIPGLRKKKRFFNRVKSFMERGFEEVEEWTGSHE